MMEFNYSRLNMHEIFGKTKEITKRTLLYISRALFPNHICTKLYKWKSDISHNFASRSRDRCRDALQALRATIQRNIHSLIETNVSVLSFFQISSYMYTLHCEHIYGASSTSFSRKPLMVSRFGTIECALCRVDMAQV